MPKYVCITRCYGLRDRLWEPGEKVEADVEEMPKDAKGGVAYFKEIKEKIEEKPEADHLEIPIDIDKPINSMKKSELLALAKQLGMDLDPTIHHFTMKSMISKRLNGDTS